MAEQHNKFTPLVLLGGIVVTGLATFMIYPLLVFRLLDVGLGMKDIGLILGFLSGTGRLFSFVIGSVNNKFGSKLTVCVGLALRVLGISVFAFNVSVATYAICAALSSLGSAAASLGIKTELFRISTSRKYLTMRSMAINSGAIAGPAIGATLYHFLSFQSILYISIATYLVLTVVFLFTAFSPPESKSTPATMEGKRPNGYLGYLAITLVVALYCAGYSQWDIVVPLLAERVFGYKAASNGIYIANAVIVLVLQYPVVVVLLKAVKDRMILLLGFLLFLTAFVSLVPSPSFVTVAMFCGLLSTGEVLAGPIMDAQTAKLAPPSLGLTRAYGFQETLTGLFSIAGSTLGGWMIEYFGATSGSAVLGIVVASLAMLTILVVLKDKSKQSVPGS